MHRIIECPRANFSCVSMCVCERECVVRRTRKFCSWHRHMRYRIVHIRTHLNTHALNDSLCIWHTLTRKTVFDWVISGDTFFRISTVIRHAKIYFKFKYVHMHYRVFVCTTEQIRTRTDRNIELVMVNLEHFYVTYAMMSVIAIMVVYA